ncbi:hypothetical protein [Planctomycetes bacterium Poly30]
MNHLPHHPVATGRTLAGAEVALKRGAARTVSLADGRASDVEALANSAHLQGWPSDFATRFHPKSVNGLPPTANLP